MKKTYVVYVWLSDVGLIALAVIGGGQNLRRRNPTSMTNSNNAARTK